METCIECDSHKVINDPDPEDWFCDDDVAVVCTLTKNENRDTGSKYLADHSEFNAITCSCRPYRVEKETPVPDWCPKL